VPSILVLFTVPNRLNKNSNEENKDNKDGEEGTVQKKITFKMLLTNKRAIVSAVSSMFAMIFMLFMDTIYSNYLILVGVPETSVGYFFALACLVYSIFAPLVGILCNYIAKPYLTQFAFIMSFVSLILFGPSQVLGIPQKLWIMILGNALNGFAVSFVFVPLLAEIIDAVKDKEGIEGDNEQVSDLASGMFNTSYAIGCLIAPILGGLFNDLYGFRYTCDIMAFSSLVLAVAYLFIILIPFVID
jgi:MFS family permease